ncbi:D-hexose-6-phosphate mutarotase [Pseudomonas sp. RP23018S]|uniref:D-hexose-6-phosphate mutarotase n=1 Tax=Pseudomonas sp. RP23018S TaxID=3096037 RepID=UPI002ACA72EB|nr:D-hexose-6-phosphate mutarotase [Pseudomonas sp. RP23018S]MDZ5605160.1 D-hexose-6-phosphate mutarotase [Pseudomonas sp. RP23018S]
MPEHPLHCLFSPDRPRPTFEWTRHQQRDVLVIDHPRCQAVFSRQGGQLLHFQPTGELPWLWCAAQWPHVGAIRGGVPVCWPWYGRHPSEDLWPTHGWARLLDWELLSSEQDEAGVSLTWQLRLCDWQVELRARLSSTMELVLTTEHQDSETCQLSHALLAYWRISHVSKIALSGLENVEGYDHMNRSACRQTGALKVHGGCQRVYPGMAEVQVQDADWQRALCIDTSDGDDTVVWHPGSRPLVGVTGREARGFVCVEAASGCNEGLSLAPGEQAQLRLQAHRLS